MKYWCISFVLVCFLAGCASVIKKEDILIEAKQIKAESIAQPAVNVEQNPVITTESNPVSSIPATVPLSSPIYPTQKLIYKAKYLGIPFCEYIVQNKGKTAVNGKEAYLLEIEVKTNPILEKLFQNKDRYVSYMDTEKLVVLRHEEYVNKGVLLESSVDFDYTTHVARYKNYINHSEKTTPIPDKIFDIVSGGFYLRMIPWELGDVVEMNIYADEKIYNFVGLVHSRTVLNLPPHGKQEAYLFKPYLFENGVQVKNLSAEAFFSPVILRTPLRAILHTFLGSIAVVLVEEPI